MPTGKGEQLDWTLLPPASPNLGCRETLVLGTNLHLGSKAAVGDAC